MKRMTSKAVAKVWQGLEKIERDCLEDEAVSALGMDDGQTKFKDRDIKRAVFSMIRDGSYKDIQGELRLAAYMMDHPEPE